MGDPWDKVDRYDPRFLVPSSERYDGYEFAHDIGELASEVRASVIKRLLREAPRLLEVQGSLQRFIGEALDKELAPAMRKWLARANATVATEGEGL